VFSNELHASRRPELRKSPDEDTLTIPQVVDCIIAGEGVMKLTVIIIDTLLCVCVGNTDNFNVGNIDFETVANEEAPFDVFQCIHLFWHTAIGS
jgi:hypothetical protein